MRSLGEYVAASVIVPSLSTQAFQLGSSVSGIVGMPRATSSDLLYSVPSQGNARGRLLLISWHFPPSNAAGATRWERMTQLGAEYGWEFDVIMDASAARDLEIPDSANLPPGLRVYTIAARPSRLNRYLNPWLARIKKASAGGSPAILTPDRHSPKRTSYARAEIAWWPLSRSLLRRTANAVRDHFEGLEWAKTAAASGVLLGRRAAYRAIISSGPPHFAHEAGRRAGEALSIPAIMDMRDPWSLQQRLVAEVASPIWYLLAGWHEARIAEGASLVCVNTEVARIAMALKYPSLTSRILTVMNGWDEDPLPPLRPTRFSIRYAGAVYLDRNPSGLFHAVREIIDRHSLTPQDLTVEFMGDVEALDGMTLERLARESGIEAFFRLHPAGTRKQAELFASEAAVLVSLPQDSTLAIPSKIYEYMRFPARILALAPPDSATEALLRNENADVAHPDDVASIAQSIRGAFLTWRQGQAFQPLAHNGRFSRRGEAMKFFDAVANVVK